jgi:hypothetical protein
MQTRREAIRVALLTFGFIVIASALLSGQHSTPPCCGMHMNGVRMNDRQADMAAIHSLFADREKIERSVVELPNGVETTTESTDPGVAARIAGHVYAMKDRMEKKQPIRMWDPLFAELFANAEKIRMEITKTANGVVVRETSDDPDVVKPIQAHAEAVSRFLELGMKGMHELHNIP